MDTNNNIIDSMFTKRFCLPSGTGLESFKSGKNVARDCLCGNYYHISCAFQGKLKGKASLL